MRLKRCRICKSRDLKFIFSLGKQPLANNLLRSPKEKTNTFPLELVQCRHCSFIQLSYIVPKEKMFDNYFYIPSVAQTYLKHFDNLSAALIKDLNLAKKSLVVDIGGSDGSLLEFFQKKGMQVINIEPARNIKSKVPKLNFYFTKENVKKMVKKYGRAKLATATNVFAHIHDLDEFITGLDHLLDEDGVFFAQFPDVRNLLKENQFDTIYHEHLSYFTYEPLHHLFINTPFEIFRIDNSEIHGGSMKIYVRRRKKFLATFVTNVKKIKKELVTYIKTEKKKGKKIVAFGAAAKGMVLLYYFGLDASLIDYVADGTPYKQGKFTPGTKIPVKSEEELLRDMPDIILILAWNYKEEIIAKVRKMLKKSKKKITFIVPIPRMQIISE